MTTIEDVLETYLAGDLKELNKTTVGYPILATAFSGIELMGALLSSQPFAPNDGRKYFSEYWTQHLYPSLASVGQADAIYSLARHGVAHQFFVKGLISVMSGAPSQHLTHDGTCLWIDVHTLTDDLLASYARAVRPLLQSSARTAIDQRFQEIVSAGKNASANQNLHTLFPPTPVVLAGAMPPQGPTGPITSSMA